GLWRQWFVGYAEQALCFGRSGPRVPRAGEVTDGGADTERGRCEQDPLGQAAFIVSIQVRHFWPDHDGNASGGGCQVAGVGAIDRRQASQRVTIANYHELPGLTVAGAARPAPSFENVVQDWLGKRVLAALSYGTEA